MAGRLASPRACPALLLEEGFAVAMGGRGGREDGIAVEEASCRRAERGSGEAMFCALLTAAARVLLRRRAGGGLTALSWILTRARADGDMDLAAPGE